MRDFTHGHAIPVIGLWDHLLVSLQGDVTDAQAELLRSDILERVRRSRAEGLVVDVSGLAVIDSHLCSVLAGITAAAQLMGVRSILCGLSPEVVMTLQAMGIELGAVETRMSLEDALESLGMGPRSAEDDEKGGDGG